MGGGADEVPETSEEKALAEIAMGQLDRYEKTLAPFEDKWIKGNEVTEGDREQVGGIVNADIAQRSAEGQQSLDRQSAKMGIGVGDGAKIAADTDLAVQNASGAARSQAAAGLAMSNRDIKGKMDAVSLLRGQGVDAMQGISDTASQASRDATNKAIDDRNTSQSIVSSAASGLGAYAAYKNPPVKEDR